MINLSLTNIRDQHVGLTIWITILYSLSAYSPVEGSATNLVDSMMGSGHWQVPLWTSDFGVVAKIMPVSRDCNESTSLSHPELGICTRQYFYDACCSKTQ